MASQLSVILERFGLVKFSLLQRSPDPCWHIRFRGPDGRRIVRPSRQVKRREAIDAASTIISAEYNPAPQEELSPVFALWDDSMGRMKQEMTKAGLRLGSIADYCT